MPQTRRQPRPDPSTPPGAPDANRDVIIDVSDFAAAYDDRTILHDVNFQVRRGEVLFIAGDSGSGKSTVLKHMIGLYRPARGRILIDGDDLFDTPAGPGRDKIFRKFGVSFQSGALFGSMSVIENVKLQLTEFAHLTGARADAIALAKLQLVGLADSAQKAPADLSGGMQKRAAIARALALDPSIVFMDEPSAGLDPITSAEMDQLILSLNKLLNTTFVIVSHELASIFNIAHRVLLFQGSKQTLVAQGKPRELAEKSDDPWVRAFFNRETPRQEARDGKAAEKGRTGARRAGGDAPPAGQSDGKRGAP